MACLLLALAGCGPEPSPAEQALRDRFERVEAPRHQRAVAYRLARTEWEIACDELAAEWLADPSQLRRQIAQNRRMLDFWKDHAAEMRRTELVLADVKQNDDASVSLTYRQRLLEPVTGADRWRMEESESPASTETLVPVGGVWKFK
jgi:hypothetical protein